MRVLIGLFALVPWVAGAQFSTDEIPPSETEQIGEGLYAFRWGAYRSIFMVTGAGVILTDPISTTAAAVYREAIAQVTDEPVKYVVYSHSHWDHAAGGGIFKAEGAKFVAHERCIENWKLSPHPDIIPPDITFSQQYSVRLGGRSLDLHYFGPSHGTCLVVMIPRPEPMLITVDIVSPPSGWYVPWDPMVADFHFYNVVAYLKGVEALAEREGIQSIVGGHLVPETGADGKLHALASVGPVAAVKQRRLFWEQVLASVAAEFEKGTPSFLVPARVDLTAFETARGFDEANMRLLLRRVASYYAIGR